MASKLITKQTIALGFNEKIAPNVDINVGQAVLIMPSTRASGAASWNMYYKGERGKEINYSFAQATLGANVAAVITTMINGNTEAPSYKSYTGLLTIDSMRTTSVSFVVNEAFIISAILNSAGNTEIVLDWFGATKTLVVTGNQL